MPGHLANMTESSRRCFLTVLGGCALAGAGACSAAAGVPPEHVGDVSAGNIRDLPVSTLRALPPHAVAIGRDENGVYAMTLTCTHQGANMATNGTVDFAAGVYCYLHGSKFNANGSVVAGPAPDPLEHFAVELDAAGELTIHGGQSVSASSRTSVA